MNVRVTSSPRRRRERFNTVESSQEPNERTFPKSDSNTLLSFFLSIRAFFIELYAVAVAVIQLGSGYLEIREMFGGGRSFAAKDIPDQGGRVFLVTGGNTGLGKEAVDQIAAHNPAHIYLAARTPSKGEAAVASVKNLVSDVPITYLPLDLSSFDSIVSAVQSFKSKSDHLDVLMNNAGIMATPSDTTKEGYEIQFGTNHIGHALLTKLLLPTLLSTAEKPGSDVRIVNLTSEGHRLAPSGGIVFDQAKLKDVGPWGRYGQSKLSNILFAKELAKRYPSITSVAVHPGVIITNLYTPNAQTSFLMRIFVAVSGSFLGKPSTGALNQLWAATAAKDELSNGAYYTPIGKPSSGSGYAKDDKLANALWEWTEDELTSNEFST